MAPSLHGTLTKIYHYKSQERMSQWELIMIKNKIKTKRGEISPVTRFFRIFLLHKQVPLTFKIPKIVAQEGKMVKPLLTGGNRIAELTSTRHVDRYVWSSSPHFARRYFDQHEWKHFCHGLPLSTPSFTYVSASLTFNFSRNFYQFNNNITR